AGAAHVAEILAVRRQLSAEKVAAENASRLLEDAMLRRLSRGRIGRLAGDIDLLDKRMVEIVASDTVLAHRYRLLTSMPGVGSLLACTLIALLPELGYISTSVASRSLHWSALRRTRSRAARSRAGGASGVVVRMCARCSTW